jgi:hypothetical protein
VIKDEENEMNQDVEFEIVDEDPYCMVCGHFNCPVVNQSDVPKSDHLPNVPCGDYRCCIN